MTRSKKRVRNREGFEWALQTAVGDEGKVRDLPEKMTLEVMDLDPMILEEDAVNGVDRKDGGRRGRSASNSAIYVFPSNAKQQCFLQG